MKIISVFNNKGGVGKSTLSYHLGKALGTLSKKVLFVDLDPQCNLTINAIRESELEKIWSEEDDFIDDYEGALNRDDKKITELMSNPRSIHFLLKPVEDGLNDVEELSPAIDLSENVYLVPGRLSLHKFENRVSERWSGLYQNDNLSIRTVTSIRNICQRYAEKYDIDYVIVDTSPSLGILNKTIISTVDGFIIPAQPDMFSLYGIRNIGTSLESWGREFGIIYSLISKDKRIKFPDKSVQFLGYTLYNAKKYDGKNEYGLADAHFSYAKRIPSVIERYINSNNKINYKEINNPIANNAVVHSHNTFPSVAQALKCAMWEVPDTFQSLKDTEYLKDQNIETFNTGNNSKYKATLSAYQTFAKDLMERIEVL